MTPVVKTFDEARELSITKWDHILEELNEIESTIGEPCGFCLLGDYEWEQSEEYSKCKHCLVEDKCQEYKDEMESTFSKFQNWVIELIEWLDDLKEENTTSRYLERKKIEDE